jgi:peptide/nickel transport system substrate-binding protein
VSRRQLLKYLGVGAGTISLSPILAACTSSGSKKARSQAGPGGAGRGGTLSIAARQTPVGLDHDFYFAEEDHQIRMSIYENLMAFSTTTQSDGLVVPVYDVAKMQGRLAESWEVSTDNRTLTVHLRKGVMSHAGNELTAEDVQYTWDRGWKVNGSSAFYAQVIFGFKKPDWHVADKYTWEITTPQPSAVLTMMMMNNDLNILDAAEVKKHATSSDPWAKQWLASGDAGHGAYALQQWRPGSQVVLKAFPDYYRGSSTFDQVVYKQVPEGSNRAALVQSGSVNIAENVPYLNLSKVKDSQQVRLWQTTGNRLFRFEMNNARPPLNDVRVRQALLYATPQDDILRSLFFGFATAEKSPVPSTYPGYDGSFWDYPHDPTKAKQLLDAGSMSPAILPSWMRIVASKTADSVTIRPPTTAIEVSGVGPGLPLEDTISGTPAMGLPVSATRRATVGRWGVNTCHRWSPTNRPRRGWSMSRGFPRPPTGSSPKCHGTPLRPGKARRRQLPWG